MATRFPGSVESGKTGNGRHMSIIKQQSQKSTHHFWENLCLLFQKNDASPAFYNAYNKGNSTSKASDATNFQLRSLCSHLTLETRLDLSSGAGRGEGQRARHFNRKNIIPESSYKVQF